ncbi:hypothetical protein [Nocardioides sp. B-3]|uniref:hypothetical protein n=1 Tax=Nocardioides sp. B-3 TaxID=2895565 RepID=UPI002152F385|nr:hypothetical protein [Nocardioides sp. B-3]UUZ60455.1 hypothetical protein LP418_06110 [Nocardioides sp. B-3]
MRHTGTPTTRRRSDAPDFNWGINHDQDAPRAPWDGPGLDDEGDLEDRVPENPDDSHAPDPEDYVPDFIREHPFYDEDRKREDDTERYGDLDSPWREVEAPPLPRPIWQLEQEGQLMAFDRADFEQKLDEMCRLLGELWAVDTVLHLWREVVDADRPRSSAKDVNVGETYPFELHDMPENVVTIGYETPVEINIPSFRYLYAKGQVWGDEVAATIRSMVEDPVRPHTSTFTEAASIADSQLGSIALNVPDDRRRSTATCPTGAARPPTSSPTGTAGSSSSPGNRPTLPTPRATPSWPASPSWTWASRAC